MTSLTILFTLTTLFNGFLPSNVHSSQNIFLFLPKCMFFLPNNLSCWVSVKMVLAQPSLSISLYVSALENMAKVHAIHIDPCVHQDPHLSFTASIYLRFMRSNSSLLQTELISDACQLPFRSARVYVTFKYLNFASTSSWENYNHQPPRQQSQDPCSGKQVCFQRYLWPTVNFIYQASRCGSILYSWFGPIISGLLQYWEVFHSKLLPLD